MKVRKQERKEGSEQGSRTRGRGGTEQDGRKNDLEGRMSKRSARPGRSTHEAPKP
jgi:hypothetical protein